MILNVVDPIARFSGCKNFWPWSTFMAVPFSGSPKCPLDRGFGGHFGILLEGGGAVEITLHSWKLSHLQKYAIGSSPVSAFNVCHILSLLLSLLTRFWACVYASEGCIGSNWWTGPFWSWRRTQVSNSCSSRWSWTLSGNFESFSTENTVAVKQNLTFIKFTLNIFEIQ